MENQKKIIKQCYKQIMTHASNLPNEQSSAIKVALNDMLEAKGKTKDVVMYNRYKSKFISVFPSKTSDDFIVIEYLDMLKEDRSLYVECGKTEFFDILNKNIIKNFKR